MRDGKQARILLEAAKRDYSALTGMDDTVVFSDEIFGFHVQQAIEKLLKAWLASLDIQYPITHDLQRLLQILEQNNQDVSQFGELHFYTPFSVQFRYGDVYSSVGPVNRHEAKQQVEILLQHVKNFLEQKQKN